MSMRNMLLAGGMLAVAAPLMAQDASKICMAIGHIEDGQWAEYETDAKGPDGQSISALRFAVVGGEEVAGKEHLWYEFSAMTERGPLVVQFLVPGYPFDPTEIRGMIMKAGDGPALKLPAQMVAAAQQQIGSNPLVAMAEECQNAELVGEEKITVPAGTFRATHIRDATGAGEAWISTNVPFGLVKVREQDGVTMVLTGHGEDAESSIKETPQELPMAPGMDRKP